METILLYLLIHFVAATANAGAWGEGSFENDEALDWVAECENIGVRALVNSEPYQIDGLLKTKVRKILDTTLLLNRSLKHNII